MHEETTSNTAADVIDVDALEIITAPTLTLEMRAGIQLAHQYPRDLGRFASALMTAATTDPEIAAMCFYTVPRGGTRISGPSVRLAELAVSAYRNVAVGSRPGYETSDGKAVVGIGFAHDLEANVPVQCEVQRPIVTKRGDRFPDHLISTTMMAACAIARRNAVLQVIPRVYVERAYKAAMQVASGGTMPLADRRSAAIEALGEAGISEARVLAALGRTSVEMIEVQDIAHLRGLFTALRDGETTADVAFPEPDTLSTARLAAPGEEA